MRNGNDEDALYDINNAIRIYEDWGAIAKAKAEQLKEKHGKLLGLPSEMKNTPFSSGRHSPMIDDQSSGYRNRGSSQKVEFK